MYSWTIAFVVGVWVLQQSAQLPSIYCLFLLPLVLIAHYYSRLRLLGALLLGLLWALLYAHTLSPVPLPTALEGEVVVTEGTIVSLPLLEGRRWRFDFQPTKLLVAGREIPYQETIQLSWYGNVPQRGCRQQPRKGCITVQAGERWRLTVKLKRPHAMRNPGGFDYEGWLYRRGIGARGYVRSKGENLPLDTEPTGAVIEQIRERLLIALERSLGDHPLKGLIIGLAIGERYGVGKGQWQILRRTGTSHLLAISGLHIGLVATLCYLLISLLWRRSERAVLWLPAPKVAVIGALLGALLYAAMAGFTIPTRRALIMVTAVVMQRLTGRTCEPFQTLTLALLAIVISEPTAVLEVGFWLSFSAVALILYSMSQRQGCSSVYWRWGRVHLVVTIGLLPLLALYFHGFSVSSPLANLFAVPWVGSVVVPTTLLGTLLTPLSAPLATLLLQLAADLLSYCWIALAWLSEAMPLWQVTEPTGWRLVMALVGIIWLLTPQGWPARWLGVVMVVPLLLRPQLLDPGHYRVALLDVGQGLAVVVETAHHTLVYDTGPRYSSRFDTGTAVVLPYLHSRGIGKIDRLVVSHEDNDHSGGAAALLKAIPVGSFLSGGGFNAANQTASPCRRGERWQWDGVHFEILHPPTSSEEGNEGSCVVQVTGEGGTTLLTGDIGYSSEAALVEHYGGQLASQLLIAPHHGSRTSSSRPFLEQVAPQWVAISSGYRNRFALPNSTVVARYRDLGLTVLNTAQSGALLFDFATVEQQPTIVHYREQQRRYWHHR